MHNYKRNIKTAKKSNFSLFQENIEIKNVFLGKSLLFVPLASYMGLSPIKNNVQPSFNWFNSCIVLGSQEILLKIHWNQNLPIWDYQSCIVSFFYFVWILLHLNTLYSMRYSLWNSVRYVWFKSKKIPFYETDNRDILAPGAHGNITGLHVPTYI